MKVLLALVVPVLLGCRTIETRQVSSTPAPLVRVGTRARAWNVHAGGELVGQVVLFQERGFARDSVYIVRNPWHQDLGLIDGLGRAYRYLPHLEDPAWVGSGTIAQGVARILDLGDGCDLVEIEDPQALGPTPGQRDASRAEPADGPASAPPLSPVREAAQALPPDGGLAPGH